MRGTRARRRTSESGLLAVGLLAAALGIPFLAAPVHAASATVPLTGGISGPSQVGWNLSAAFIASAHGGPAEAVNGTQVGTYTFNASFAAANTSQIAFNPSTGVLVNNSVSLQLRVGNVSESITLYVLVTSSFHGKNVSQNFSDTIQVVQPYQVAADLIAGAGASVAPFSITVDLDGAPVGAIPVHALLAGASFHAVFNYVPSSIAPGWHTFTLSLGQAHGLVTFVGGAEQFSSSFYVTGPPPDNTVWYLAGVSAFVGAILIWSMRVGARRRGRAKK